MMKVIQFYLDSLVHLLYPQRCEGCGADISSAEQMLCIECIVALPLTKFGESADNPVEKIFWGRLKLEAAASYVYFTKNSVMQQLLHSLKYKGRKEIGIYFGKRMAEDLQAGKRFASVDALIPLPLYRTKQKKRGYNQAQLICEGMAEVMNVPVLSDIVVRKTAGATQTKKKRTERWDNMEGRFEVKDLVALENKHALLVDDVITTGATLEACGAELLKTQNLKLSIATLAFTFK